MDFVYERKINYYETDRMGVVHHSNYIRYLEETRSRWMETFNLSMEYLEELGYTIPTIEVNCKYKFHVTSGDTIIIKPRISEFNGVRMTATYDVIDKKTGKVVVEAYTKHCFTNKDLKPINIKKHDESIYDTFNRLLKQ